MTWQEDLRRLDVKLANGKISLHEHRKQRDELLAAASGGFGASPVASPLASAQPDPVWPTTQPDPEPRTEPAPAPPPPPAPPTPPRQNRSEALLTTDRQTSAPSPADHRPTDSMPYPPIHQVQTQITQAVSPGSLPSLAPVKRSETVPRLPTTPVRPDRRKPTWLFLSLGVLVVLVLIVGGAWFFGARNTGDSAAALPPPPSSVTSQAPTTPPIEDKLPPLPGVADANNSTVSVDKGVELGLYPAKAADMYRQNGVSEVIYRGSSLNTEQYFLLVIHAADNGKANAVAAYMRAGAMTSGFQPLSTDKTIATGTQSGRAMNGTWYASGDEAVVLWVSQPSATKQTTQLKQHLSQALTTLQAVLPPN